MANPLTTSWVDENGPEPRIVTRRQTFRKLSWPLMKSVVDQRREGLELKVRPVGTRRMEVVLRKPNSDAYQLRYTFERRACWTLVRLDDESL